MSTKTKDNRKITKPTNIFTILMTEGIANQDKEKEKNLS